MSKRFAGLTPAQQRVFEQIAINNDAGHPPKVLKTLVEKGFIKEHKEVLRGFPPVKVNRYTVPLNIHLQWCMWCAEQPDSDDVVQST